MKYIKKIISLLLVLSTLYYQFFPITAFALEQYENLSGSSTLVTNTTGNTHNGTIELDVKFVLPIQNIENPNIEVKLIKGYEKSYFR